MRFRIDSADHDLTIRFEPAGQSHIIAPGDHVLIAWEPWSELTTADFDEALATGYVRHSPDEIALCAPVGHFQRVWLSSGAEFDPGC
ncbi:hypothetical protein [Nocardia camponoti]|uniref:Uncharacterized protein n=1 Tax=Nocardia camponoti TaxID=1616106 RepID=A0A917QAB3_9NOCA|nr:hypothetical protein [Nocardia camponoti]GGK38476.1 hypothetical protein GCM10011591_07730 [Nocardia camponoti]